jgi:hypothetical protein
MSWSNVAVSKMKTQQALIIAVSLWLLSACAPLISLYDQYAYTQAVSLKVDMQNLADESATTNYTDAKANVDAVNTELQKAYEYDRGRSKDSLSTKQYGILLSDKGFYKNFLKDWQTHSKLSTTAAGEMRIQIGKLMDEVIALEVGKNKK